MIGNIKQYETESSLIESEGGENIILHTPGVALACDVLKTHYNNLLEDRLICTYNISSTTEPTQIFSSDGDSTVFSSIRLDSGEIIPVQSAYTFNRTGLRTLFYELSRDTLPQKLFQHTTALVSVQVPKRLRNIPAYCFYGTSNLIEIYFHPESLSGSFGGYWSFNGSGIRRLIMPDTVTGTINNNALRNTFYLTELHISENATGTLSESFRNMSRLKKLVIPAKITSFGTLTFAGTSSLEEIWVKRMTAPQFSSSMFNGTKTGGTIHAPSGATGYENWINGEGETNDGKLNGWTIVYDNN